MLLTDLDKALEEEIRAYSIGLNSTKSLIKKKLLKSTKFKEHKNTPLSKIENKIKYENLSDKVPMSPPSPPLVSETTKIAQIDNNLEIEKISINSNKTLEIDEIEEVIEDKVTSSPSTNNNNNNMLSSVVIEEDLSMKKRHRRGSPFLKGLFRGNEVIVPQQQPVVPDLSSAPSSLTLMESQDVSYIKIDLQLDVNNEDYITLVIILQKTYFDTNESTIFKLF